MKVVVLDMNLLQRGIDVIIVIEIPKQLNKKKICGGQNQIKIFGLIRDSNGECYETPEMDRLLF